MFVERDTPMPKSFTITIAQTPEQLLAAQNHTDWLIRQERGGNRNGRPGGVGGFHGSHNTRKGRSRRACRGKVRY